MDVFFSFHMSVCLEEIYFSGGTVCFPLLFVHFSLLECPEIWGRMSLVCLYVFPQLIKRNGGRCFSCFGDNISGEM